jgi:hypothetical protein
LLKVDKENIPWTDAEDAERTVSWFSFNEALKKLSAKRDPEYARQAELVLRTALARLDGR